MNKLEFRNELSIELRAIDNTENKMIIEGIVNTIGQKSKVIWGEFQEIISKGVFERAIQNSKDNNKDIFLLFNHNSNNLMASMKSETLQLEEREEGLWMRAELPSTQLNKDCYELIKSNILREFSFGFYNVTDSWAYDENDMMIRTITELTLDEISLVSVGAYNNTQVQARSVELADILPKSEYGVNMELYKAKTKLYKLK
ncbi:HK97 family phage prohead protease [Romboutsia sedimentorum]|uniref:HK97 family phage prohead protease n=1 Tax=Romboutsia sedimentorum TaxID=1368474 RepID=UPI0024DE2B30|nr:HK97 family phage prohead protease [Romboutsia sedimentorum]MDK2587481.1 HK97 family phage prohead protease [Romboutsia sedimentorum]